MKKRAFVPWSNFRLVPSGSGRAV